MNLRDEVVLAQETAQDLSIKLDHIRAVLDGEDAPFSPLSQEEDKPEGLQNDETFGARLKRLRSWRDMTLAVLADASGLSINGVLKIEKDEVSPRMSTTFKLAKALKVPPAWLEGESWG